LWARLRPGGQLAVQLPSNHEHPAALAAAEEAGWRRASPVLPVDRYAETLWRLGGQDLNVFEKVYAHTLPDADAVCEWMRGTTLLPYLERLTADEREPFVERVRARYRRQFPERPLFFGFRRILFTASRVEGGKETP
jgi:trans-aconitate 2-methyltransferase